ncbi:hypothetical protein GCM10023195_53620 [Actinoallomurus liliacearum]|uniref:Uncharacterized protein n=1 Tax=Actinoallomurus liliacearum TaxID=1080073 RepID=A0ABP8TSI0_9ACTN
MGRVLVMFGRQAGVVGHDGLVDLSAGLGTGRGLVIVRRAPTLVQAGAPAPTALRDMIIALSSQII